ncbi:MAG: DUF1127 domain-containing protein [Deltaproteobacteria bacterium]|jgi:uncharacterized protein YjiS (DUF1127 family)|nr:DUF1127 domain-containing protein [Deltaproteobacteria bacterium]MBT4526164.1 DUF1127 domain-containing protein [Deltaproteobacteria bacterium]
MKQITTIFKTWKERSLQRKQLAVLNDTMLRDIGLTRDDAIYESYKSAWKK